MKRPINAIIGLALIASFGSALAQNLTPQLALLPAQAPATSPLLPATDGAIAAWLSRVHDASRQRAYTGTFVVSAGNRMASAKIWHICDGTQQIDRVDSLSGTARSTFRRNEQVITFYPASRVAVAETRRPLSAFPNLLRSPDASFAEHYQLKNVGSDRIAGLDADVVLLLPKDNLRFGYKVWSEKKTGLMLQLQTLDSEGRLLEQSAFSEIALDAPVSMEKLAGMMASTEGYKIERPELHATTAEAQGWSLRGQVPGFKPVGCYQRVVALAGEAASRKSGMMQWMFSDGLATVSLFVEPFDPRRHINEAELDAGGATRTLTRRLSDAWLTAVGEVPVATLTAFAQALERKK